MEATKTVKDIEAIEQELIAAKDAYYQKWSSLKDLECCCEVKEEELP